MTIQDRECAETLATAFGADPGLAEATERRGFSRHGSEKSGGSERDLSPRKYSADKRLPIIVVSFV